MPAYPALLKAFPKAALVAELPPLAPALPPRHACSRRSRRPAAAPARLPGPVRPPRQPLPGRPWPRLDRQRHPLRPAVAGRRPARPNASPLDWRPDVVHLNDWQTALAPAWLHYEGGAASVVTVHNIAFQGNFAPGHLSALGLPEHAWHMHGVEYHGQLSFLKAGLQLATLISTVSPTYAREIQDEDFGYGLAPLLRHRSRRAARHPQRRRHDALEPGRTTRHWPPPMPPTGWPPSARTSARCSRNGPRCRRRPPAVRHHQPPHATRKASTSS
jgi:starch synthase